MMLLTWLSLFPNKIILNDMPVDMRLLKKILRILFAWSLSVHQFILKYWLLPFKSHWVGVVGVGWGWLEVGRGLLGMVGAGGGGAGWLEVVEVYWKWLSVVRGGWSCLKVVGAYRGWLEVVGAVWRWFCEVKNWMNVAHIARKLLPCEKYKKFQ